MTNVLSRPPALERQVQRLSAENAELRCQLARAERERDNIRRLWLEEATRTAKTTGRKYEQCLPLIRTDYKAPPSEPHERAI